MFGAAEVNSLNYSLEEWGEPEGKVRLRENAARFRRVLTLVADLWVSELEPGVEGGSVSWSLE